MRWCGAGGDVWRLTYGLAAAAAVNYFWGRRSVPTTTQRTHASHTHFKSPWTNNRTVLIFGNRPPHNTRNLIIYSTTTTSDTTGRLPQRPMPMDSTSPCRQAWQRPPEEPPCRHRILALCKLPI